MKKKILSALLAAAMLVSFAVCAGATELPEDYFVHQLDGMDRVIVTSSYSPDSDGKIDTAPLFDHRTETGCMFDFADSESKTFTLYIGSRDSEIVNKFSGLFAGVEGTEVEIAFYATDNSELTEWTMLDVHPLVKDGDWHVIEVENIEKGYAFYRIDFTLLTGDSFGILELSLFRTAVEKEETNAPSSVLFEREQWRKVPLRGKRLF